MREILIVVFIVFVSLMAALAHEGDMLNNIEDGYIYTWTKGDIDIKKDNK